MTNSRGFITAAAALLLVGFGTAPAHAQFADFDTGTGFDCTNTGGGAQLIAAGYAGFNWSNFYVANGAGVAALYPGQGEGYENGTISAPCMAFNGFGSASAITSASPFTFNGGYFTAAFSTSLSLQITGFSGVNQLFQTMLTLDKFTPQNLSVEWAGLDRVTFASGDGQPGSQFVFDNFRFNGAVDPNTGTVPEPATMTLLATGLAGMAAARRRKKNTA